MRSGPRDGFRWDRETIVYAIDHPEYEFSAVLEQYNTTNNFGSVVNMNGGRGNTGIKL